MHYPAQLSSIDWKIHSSVRDLQALLDEERDSEHSHEEDSHELRKALLSAISNLEAASDEIQEYIFY